MFKLFRQIHINFSHIKKCSLYKLFFVVTIFSLTNFSFSAQYRWDNTEGDYDIENLNNWSVFDGTDYVQATTPPAQTDDFILGADGVVPAGVELIVHSFTVSNGYTLNNLGKLIITGNFTDEGTYIGDGELCFNGTQGQTFTAYNDTDNPHTYNKIIVSKTSGNFTTGNRFRVEDIVVDCNGVVSFNRSLTFGKITIVKTGGLTFSSGFVLDGDFIDSVGDTGNITFSNTYSNPVTFGGKVSFNTTGTVSFNTSITFSDEVEFNKGSVSFGDVPVFSDKVSFTDVSSVSFPGAQTFPDTATFANVGTLTFTDTSTFTGDVEFNNVTNLTFTQNPIFNANVSFTDVSSVSFPGAQTFPDMATFTNVGTLTFTDTSTFTGDVEFNNVTNLTFTQNPIFNANVSFIDVNNLSFVGPQTFPNNTIFTNVNNLTFNDVSSFTGDVNFSNLQNLTFLDVATFNADVTFNDIDKITFANGQNIPGDFSVDSIVILNGNLTVDGDIVLSDVQTHANSNITGKSINIESIIPNAALDLQINSTNGTIVLKQLGTSLKKFNTITLDSNGRALFLNDKTSLDDITDYDIFANEFVQNGIGDVNISADISCTNDIVFNTTNIILKGNVALKTNDDSKVLLNSTNTITLNHEDSYELYVLGSLENKGNISNYITVNVTKDAIVNKDWSSGGILSFNGTTDQYLKVQAASISFQNINIDKTSGNFIHNTNSITVNGKLDIINAKNITFDKPVSISSLFIDKSEQITFNDNANFYGNVLDESYSGKILFNQDVSFVNGVEFSTTSLVQLGSSASCTININNSKNLKHTSGNTILNGTIIANKITLANTQINSKVEINSSDITFANVQIAQDAETQINANQITFKGNMDFYAPVTINANCIVENALILTSSALVKISDGKSFTCNGTFFQYNKDGTLRSDSKIMFGGSFVANSNASFGSSTLPTDVYFYGENTNTCNLGANGSTGLTVYGNLVIATNSSRTTNITSNTYANNFVLYKGKINLSNNIMLSSYVYPNSLGDIVLLGSNYNIKDNSTGINEEYKYQASRGSAFSTNKYTLEAALPDGTLLPTGQTGNLFGGSFVCGQDCILHAGQNFYANGLSFTASEEWYIDILKNSDSSICFAECYNCTVSKCVVRNHNGTNISGIVNVNNSQMMAENCTLTNCSNWDDSSFEIVRAYTVRDNVVRVEFTSPVRNYNGELNGKKDAASSNIINVNGLSNVKYKNNDGNNTAYNKVFKDEECTVELSGDLIQSYEDTSTTPAKTLYYCYLKAPSTWATDATGNSSGKSGTTDRYGNVRDVSIPFIQIPRADLTKNFIITDRFGKRLKNYNSNGITGQTEYTATTDKTAPSLISVKTGQENHEDAATAQWSYDAHNFIEFAYSEWVDFGTSDGNSINNLKAQNVNNTNPSTSVSQNIKVSSALGGITQNMTTTFQSGVTTQGITFIGLGKTSQGYLYTATNGNATLPADSTGNTSLDNTKNFVNALYRTNQSSIRISIAGYTNGTVTNNFKKWIGYIESAKIPTGSVTVLVDSNNLNKCVKDTSGNYQRLYVATDKTYVDTGKTNSNNQVNVSNSEENGTCYGGWDLSEPVFVKVFKSGSSSPESYYEAVGTANSGSNLTHVDIHISDNTSGDKFTDGSSIGSFITSFGWSIDGNTLASSDANCADLVGGARPYNSDFTKGGLRYCTFYDKVSSFTYTTEGSAAKNFASITPGGIAPIFTGSSSSRRNVSTAKDNTYLRLELSDSGFDFNQTFGITYNDTNCYITDLAGNRLRSSVQMQSIDRTPPAIDFVIAPVGQDEIYIQFVKKLTKDIQYKSNPSSTDLLISETFEQIIPYCFKIGTINGSGTFTTSSDLQIDTSVPATIISEYSNDSFTAVKLKLTRNVTLQDVKTLYIRLTNAIDGGTTMYNAQSYDPFTNVANSYVSFVQDHLGNYMQMYTAHALSDFAINVINPSYAYNPSFTDEDGNFIQEDLYTSNSTAVHDWGKNQGNYGTLRFGQEVLLLCDVTDGTATGTAENAPSGSNNIPPYIKLVFSSNPTAHSESEQYNSDLNKNGRIWIPTTPFAPFSLIANTNISSLQGEYNSSDGGATYDGGITFTFTDAICSTWNNPSQVSFLFELQSSLGTPITIVHEPELNVSTLTYNISSTAPLYALRLTNPNDITSIDMWSFRIKGISLQRGGVSILNNVINPNNGEKTVVQINMGTQGSVSIMVMTLDGSIITYLNRGELSSGEHNFTWDGKNAKGKTVARGMYFIRIVGNGIDETRKVMIVK